jgi:hypothetical protein
VRGPGVGPRVGIKPRAVTSRSHPGPEGATSATTSADEGSSTASTLRSALSVITAVGTPLTMITALMLYFGWARSNAQSKWMGIDVSLFHLSAQDYVLRSISTLFVPLLVAAVVGIAWLELHRRITASIDPTTGSRAVRVAGATTMYVGLGAAIVGVVLAAMKLPWPPSAVVFPLLLAAGTALAAYGHHVVRAGTKPGAAQGPARWQGVLQNLLVGVVVAVAVFWAVGAYAGIVGRGIAEQFERKPSTLPRAMAISENPLGFDAPNVATTPFMVGPKTLYRTTGLRLLGESGGRLFLLNDGWSPSGGRVMVFDADKSVLWQFSR